MAKAANTAPIYSISYPFSGAERSEMFTALLLIIGALVALYLYSTRNYRYWQKREIPCVNGALPGIGHMLGVCMGEPMSNCYNKIYRDYKNRSMVGLYNFSIPTLMVREPELVKTVMQSKFANFHENGFKIDFDLDPLLANNPFFNKGEKWNLGRKRLTYAFTNVRLKTLLESVKQVCEALEKYLNEKIDKTGKTEVELKDICARFTAQVVAGSAFGVDGLSFDDSRHDESFYAMGKTFLEPDNSIMFYLTFLMPFLNKFLRIGFIPKKVDTFFRNLVKDIMKQRRVDGVTRNDFIQLMVELERLEGDEFDLESVTSHATSFFIDGYETASSVLSFMCFQLAAHPEVQEKLRDEVTSVLKKYNGVLTYEAIKDMTYMDQVLSETQRTIPIIGFLWKVCTEECELRGSDGLVCRIQSGCDVVIPVRGLHEDAKYWENPEVFDPERFSPERRQNIDRFTFIPFGEGPRMCVGMRMAILQMKACLATLMKKYRFEVSPKTQLPLQMMLTMTFIPRAKGGLWIYMRPL